MPLPKMRVLNSLLSRSVGRDVVLVEVLPVATAQVAVLQFLGGRSPWRQGVWIGTDGLLDVEDSRSPQLTLWVDTAPAQVGIRIVETDGWLRFYNVWDSGRGLGPFESQKATSGMLVSGSRYDCSDIAVDPQFDRLSFVLEVREDGDRRAAQ